MRLSISQWTFFQNKKNDNRKTDVRIVLSVAAMRCMSTLGSNLSELILGEVGEIARVGIGHYVCVIVGGELDMV